MMQFKYKIKKRYGLLSDYNIIIKKRYHIFSNVYVWLKFEEVSLRKMLYGVSPEVFSDVTCTWELPINDLYNGLKQYNSMEELVMKYIIKSIDDVANYMDTDRLLDEFVFANGKHWTTIEVKGSKE